MNIEDMGSVFMIHSIFRRKLLLMATTLTLTRKMMITLTRKRMIKTQQNIMIYNKLNKMTSETLLISLVFFDS